jgi:hypothetical protein
VLGTALGLVVLDRGAKVVVEHVAASKIQDCLGTPDKPDVNVSGFPLLPDLIRGRVKHLTMTAHDAQAQSGIAGGVRVAELHVDAHGVERKGAGGSMDSLTGTGLVTYDAMSAAAMGMTVSYGGDHNVKIAGGLGPFSGSATATPQITDGSLVLQPGQVTSLFGNFDVSGLGPIRIALRELPAGVDVNLNPTERGLEFTFSGTDVRMPDNPCGSS